MIGAKIGWMRILLANPRGFCAGVRMAIDCVERVLALHGAPVHVFHEIVHNRHVVEDFQRRGVVFINDLNEAPRGAVVVYSAHGISPEVRRLAASRKLIEIDATCPLVTKVHLEVLRFAKMGCRVIFVGHKNHDEAVGTVGEAPDCIHIVENEADVAMLDIPPDAKVAYVTQTTLSVADCRRTVEALKSRWPGILSSGKGDICYATTNRQSAVSELSAEADLVLVVGSRNSSNSRRLVETAKSAGKPAHLIDDQGDLDMAWFAGVKTVLVTAGASAPDHLIVDLLERLKREFSGVVEERTLALEDVSFEPPKSLQRLM